MAKITVEVKGVNTGGGNQNQNPPQQPSSPQPTQPQPQPAQPASSPQPTQPQPQQPTPPPAQQPTQPQTQQQPQPSSPQTAQPQQPAQPTPPNVGSKPYQRSTDEDDSRTTKKPNYQRSTTDDGSGQPAASPTPSGKPYQRSVDTTQGGQQTTPQTAQAPHPGAATQAANQYSGNQNDDIPFTVQSGIGNGAFQQQQDTGTKTQDDTLPDDDEVVDTSQPPVSSPPVQPTPAQPTPPPAPQQPNQPQQQPSQPQQPPKPTPPSPNPPNQPNQPGLTPPNPNPNQPGPTPPNGPGNPPPGGPNNPPPPGGQPPFVPYQRPNFNQYLTPGGGNNMLPTTDRMVNDIRSEISRRGIIMVPGTTNFNTMLNTMQQNQRSGMIDSINLTHDARLDAIHGNKDALLAEIDSRIEASRASELATATTAQRKQYVNKFYDDLKKDELEKAEKFFKDQYISADKDADAQLAEGEQRLTEAIQRLTEELSQGNKDSYINRLRDKYKEQIWLRDNADTEADARAASKEAAKIQERIARAQGAGGVRWGNVATQAIGLASTLANQYGNYVKLEDQERWGLPIQMSSSILSGNVYSAYRQEQAMERQKIDARWSMGGTAIGGAAGIAGGIAAGMGAGAAIGSVVPGAGTIAGLIVGGLISAAGAAIGNLTGGQLGYFLGGGRETEQEQKRADAADLWTQVESRMMQYNALAMMMRPMSGASISAIRDTYINQANVETPGMAGGAFVKGDDHIDLYDLGYSSPEFAQQVVQRTKARGFSRGFQDAEYALRADALERVYNMNSGSLNALSQYDRFGRNNATQDFANLAETLSSMGTTGMSEKSGFVRGDEFLGYMSQLGQSQRSTFLTVNNARSARQIATGQAMFGDKFGAEAMRGIEAVNNQVQNPGGGYAKTMLYDVIQELYPDTRGDIRKIREAQYDPTKQNAIQKKFAERVQEMYGGADTTSGFLAFEEIYGINNPNVLNPIVKQMTEGGGLEARGLKKADVNAKTDILNTEQYTPKATQSLKNAQDQQTALLLSYQSNMVEIANKILESVKKSIGDKLDEVVNELKVVTK